MCIIRLLSVIVLWFSIQQLSSETFRPCSFPISKEDVIVDPDALLRVAEYAHSFFSGSRKEGFDFVKSKQFDNGLITTKEAEDTLTFIIDTIKTDKKLGKAHRILDKDFLEKNFSFIRWYGDHESAKKHGIPVPIWHDGGTFVDGKIRLTSYAVFRRQGDYEKTSERSYPLYEIISKEFLDTLRFKFTRQEIFSGALSSGEYKEHVRPLVWLSEHDINEAIMQGSVIVMMPDGKSRLFNVHQHNGFMYDKSIRDPKKQKKYWFFQEIKDDQAIPIGSFYGYQLEQFGGVMFAGDVENLGLGKIIALQYKNTKTKKNEFKLGVLADRGSAFIDNLFQLDLYSGVFNSRSALDEAIKKFPPTVTPYVMKKKGAF